MTVQIFFLYTKSCNKYKLRRYKLENTKLVATRRESSKGNEKGRKKWRDEKFLLRVNTVWNFLQKEWSKLMTKIAVVEIIVRESKKVIVGQSCENIN